MATTTTTEAAPQAAPPPRPTRSASADVRRRLAKPREERFELPELDPIIGGRKTRPAGKVKVPARMRRGHDELHRLMLARGIDGWYTDPATGLFWVAVTPGDFPARRYQALRPDDVGRLFARVWYRGRCDHHTVRRILRELW
jgi:hypothetical protein